MLDTLTQMVSSWEKLGHPALLERFVLRNGKPYAPRKRIGRKRAAKQCFSNATHAVLDHVDGIYVEGYAMRHTFQLPLLHAWVGINDKAMDPTLNSKEFEYYGVAFDKTTLHRELARNGHYGLLDTGLSLNLKLIFEIDPELRDICQQIKSRRSA